MNSNKMLMDVVKQALDTVGAASSMSLVIFKLMCIVFRHVNAILRGISS